MREVRVYGQITEVEQLKTKGCCCCIKVINDYTYINTTEAGGKYDVVHAVYFCYIQISQGYFTSHRNVCQVESDSI